MLVCKVIYEQFRIDNRNMENMVPCVADIGARNFSYLWIQAEMAEAEYIHVPHYDVQNLPFGDKFIIDE